MSRSNSNSSEEEIRRFNNDELVLAADEPTGNVRSGAATWNALNVIFKNTTTKMLAKITQHEQQLLRVKSTTVLPYLAICMEPPSFLTLHMSNGALDDWLYGARSKRRSDGDSDNGGGSGGGSGSGGGGSPDKKEEKSDDDSKEDETVEEVQKHFVVSDMQVAKWAVQLASAISHLHTEQIIHGDIRCGNVLLDQNMDIKLTGFLINEPVEDYSLASSCLHWEAPEAFRHEIQAYTKTSDAYMFALTLYEMVVRDKPWGELTGKEVRVQILDQKSRPSEQPLNDWIQKRSGSDAMKSVITKCWKDDPTARMEVWQIRDVLKQMHEDCETMDHRQKKKDEEQEQKTVTSATSLEEEAHKLPQDSQDSQDSRDEEKKNAQVEEEATKQEVKVFLDVPPKPLGTSIEPGLQTRRASSPATIKTSSAPANIGGFNGKS